MTSRYSKALPPPPPDDSPPGTPHEYSYAPLHLTEPVYERPARPVRSPSSSSKTPSISMPSSLRPVAPQRRPSQPPPTQRLRKLTRIIRKPPPVVEPPSAASDSPQSTKKFFSGRSRQRSSPPTFLDGLPGSDAEESTASFSGYPSRKRDPASSRVPVPMLGEAAMSDGGFLEDTTVLPPQEPDSRVDALGRYQHPAMSPVGEADEIEPYDAPPSPPASPPKKLSGAARFKLAGLAVVGAQKFAAGAASLARRTSGSRKHNDDPSGGSQNTPEDIVNRLHAGPGGLFEPEPIAQRHPAVRMLFERAASTTRPSGWGVAADSIAHSEVEAEDSSQRLSPSSPQSQTTPFSPPPPRVDLDERYREETLEELVHDRAGDAPPAPLSDESLAIEEEMLSRGQTLGRRSTRRDGSQLRDPRQGPSSISHEGPTTEDFSHEQTYESSRPLIQTAPSSSSHRSRRRNGGKFQRNAVGMEIFAEPIIEESPITTATYDGVPRKERTPTTAIGRAVQDFLYLPLRSKTHVTVTYIPARTKPDGSTVSEPWYIPRPAKAPKERVVQPGISIGPRGGTLRSKNSPKWRARQRRSAIFSQPVLHLVETDPAHHSRYMTQEALVAGQPIQVLSETEAPISIVPGGAPFYPEATGTPTSSAAWFSQAPASTRA